MTALTLSSERVAIDTFGVTSLLEIGVDITDQHPQADHRCNDCDANRVVVLGRDAHVESVNGTPVEVWDTDERSERGIEGIERMRLASATTSTAEVERLAQELRPTVYGHLDKASIGKRPTADNGTTTTA